MLFSFCVLLTPFPNDIESFLLFFGRSTALSFVIVTSTNEKRFAPVCRLSLSD